MNNRYIAFQNVSAVLSEIIKFKFGKTKKHSRQRTIENLRQSGDKNVDWEAFK